MSTPPERGFARRHVTAARVGGLSATLSARARASRRAAVAALAAQGYAPVRLADSVHVRVLGGQAGKRWLTLEYRLYATEDQSSTPTGERVRVRFRWRDGALSSATEVPAAELRSRRG